MAYTGARKGEIVGLTWECVNFKDHTITIKETLNYTVEKGIYTDTTKNGKQRIIDVDDYNIRFDSMGIFYSHFRATRREDMNGGIFL